MEYLIYLVLGAVAGLVSGLFGLGGGAVIVPILLVVFYCPGLFTRYRNSYGYCHFPGDHCNNVDELNVYPLPESGGSLGVDQNDHPWDSNGIIARDLHFFINRSSIFTAVCSASF